MSQLLGESINTSLPDHMTRSNQKESLKALIELGANGHYPLFYDAWISEFINKKTKTPKVRALKAKEKHQVNIIIERLKKQRTIDRKKTILIGLDRSSRELFIKAFFYMVEEHIMNNKPKLQ